MYSSMGYSLKHFGPQILNQHVRIMNIPYLKPFLYTVNCKTLTTQVKDIVSDLYCQLSRALSKHNGITSKVSGG